MGATVVTDISWDSVMRLILLAARQVSKLMALDAYNVRWKVRPHMLVSGTPEVAWKLLGQTACSIFHVQLSSRGRVTGPKRQRAK